MKHSAEVSSLSAMGRRTAAPAISWLMATALARPNLISLAAGFTDNASLPVDLSRRLLAEVLGNPRQGQAALQYGTTVGEVNLRKLTARHLRAQDDGREATHTPERMIISGGSQQLLYMTMEALCDEGDIVLVEDPTYFVFLGILQSRGIQARGVRLERDGLDLAHLAAALERLKKSGELRRVKALYLVSYFQNPTGVTTTLAKKRRALALLKQYEPAAGHPLYLLEDAAYRELRFAGADTPSALTLPGAAGRVIYAGTYSKPYATGVRVGFGILPEPLFTAVTRIKGNHDFGTANLLQQLVAAALAAGEYPKHVRALRARYRAKARVMRAALAAHFPAGVEIWEPAGGLYFWARLPGGVSAGVDSAVFKDAVSHDVLYVPGELCYAPDPTRPLPANEMRISFGTASEENIREGARRLGGVLRKRLKGRGDGD